MNVVELITVVTLETAAKVLTDLSLQGSLLLLPDVLHLPRELISLFDPPVHVLGQGGHG